MFIEDVATCGLQMHLFQGSRDQIGDRILGSGRFFQNLGESELKQRRGEATMVIEPDSTAVN
jgi:hypothetical protein